MTQHHLFHPDAPSEAMQRDLANWPLIRQPWGNLEGSRIVGYAIVDQHKVMMLLQRDTKHGPHRWHISWQPQLGFYASAAGWTDEDGLSLRPGDNRTDARP